MNLVSSGVPGSADQVARHDQFAIAHPMENPAVHQATFAPMQFLQRGWGYLRGCHKHRQDIKRLLENPDLLHRCAEEREKLFLYFASKFDLSQIAFDTGTMVFSQERELFEEIVVRSNALPGPIIEIGTLFGETTTRIAIWKATHKKIITVDNYSWNPWRISSFTHESLTRRVLKYLTETGHVELHSCEKDKFFAEYRGERPSMVFLDADHSYEATKADIAWAKRVGATIISGHDYWDCCPGVGQAVTEAGGAVRHVGGMWALNGPYWETVQGKAPWNPERAKAA